MSEPVENRASEKPVSESHRLVNEQLWNFGRWLTSEDEFSDVIISSRIRLARNLKGFAFPHKASNDDLNTIKGKVKKACKSCDSLNKAMYLELESLSGWDCKYFVERRLASPQFMENSLPSLLVIDQKEDISIMVNEEDHLRIQCIEPGLAVREAWKRIAELDDELETNLNFSFTDRYGYLTSCPTNVGTGMRVSVFAHLPALTLDDEIGSTLKKLPTSEVAVRGFYGEGSESIGSIFQISNQITLGRGEEQVIERLMLIAQELVEMERKARKERIEKAQTQVEDTVFRALGVLKNARIITSLEAMNLLSQLRFGIELGLIKGMNRLAVNQLMVLVQPAHLQRIYERQLNADERDTLRSEFIRENLEGLIS